MPYGRHVTRPSLGSYAKPESRDEPDWAWFYCDTITCTYHSAIRFQTLIDRHGVEVGMDDILRRMRCPRCGHKGATMRTPSWGSDGKGFTPFPGD